MPTKQKNQHLIPRCYLAHFVSSEVPMEHQGNPHFERGVWTTSPTLDHEWKLQGVGNLLSRSYAYELPGDSPHAQKIECFLSSVESPWPGIIRTLTSQQSLSAAQESQLRIFVGALFQRTDATMGMVQSVSDQIEQLYRRVERASTGQEKAADELFRDTQHLPKMLITDPAFEPVICGLPLHFLCNVTSRPFVSSDSPVCLTHRHADEVATLLPAEFIKPSARTNLRRPLVLCPLTPALMLVACEFLADHYASFPFITLTEASHSTLLNILTIENAQDLLLSSLPAPFGPEQPAMAAVLRAGSCGARQHGAWMLLYTSERRYWLPLEADFERALQTIEFRTPALDLLQQASQDEMLVSAEIFVDGQCRGGIREIRFEDVDLTGTRCSRIGARIKLPIGK
jgi:hypothetical protein